MPFLAVRISAIVLALAFLGGTAKAQTLPDNIDITGSPNGVVDLPPTVHTVFKNVFDRYTKITAPNGQAIHFLLQDQVTDEMGARAREVMRFFLTDAPGSQYGADKTAIRNKMGNWEATLVYFNNEQAAQQAMNGPLGNANIFAQDLYATESVVEGSNPYFNNNKRDATFEEVFHLVHGAGIQPVLPAYHAEITAATDAAIAANIYNPPPPWELPPVDRPFEYIISVIDVYYGYWAHDPAHDGTAFWGEYAFNTRATVEAGDPPGVSVMRKFLPEFFTADLTCAASMSTTFRLDLVPSHEYTRKSQYMDNARLSGTKASHLVGNDRGNVLGGNAADNNLVGGPGVDTAVFQGPLAEYVLGGTEVMDTVPGRDGTDTLASIEALQFSDQTVPFGVAPYGMSCGGLSTGAGGVPVLGSAGFAVTLTGAPSGTAAVFMLGAGSLDLDMAAFGAPGCSLYQGFDVLIPVATDAAGAVSLVAPIPNDPHLLGVTVNQQWAVFDASANPLGVTASEGLAIWIQS